MRIYINRIIFKIHMIFSAILLSSAATAEDPWKGFTSKNNPYDCEPLTDISPGPLHEGEFRIERIAIAPGASTYYSSNCDPMADNRCHSTNAFPHNAEGFAIKGRASNGRVCVTTYDARGIFSGWLDPSQITLLKLPPPPLLEDWLGTWHSVTPSKAPSSFSESILIIKRKNDGINLSLYDLSAELPLVYTPTAYGGKNGYILNINPKGDMILYNGKNSKDPLSKKEGTKLAGALIDGHFILTITTSTGGSGHGTYRSLIFVKGDPISNDMISKSPDPPISFL